MWDSLAIIGDSRVIGFFVFFCCESEFTLYLQFIKIRENLKKTVALRFKETGKKHVRG